MDIIKNNKVENKDITVGDIIEGGYTGDLYLITKVYTGKFGWVNLSTNEMTNETYDTIEEVMDATAHDYKVHKSHTVKLYVG